MKRRSIFTSALLFSLSLSVASGCSNQDSQIKLSNSPNAGDVKVGFSAWVGWFPWQVAKEAGIFQQNKVNVNMKWFDNYVDSLTALNAGTLDGNSQTLTETIAAVSTGKDLVIVLTNDNSNGSDKIIISDKIKSIKDLKGKKIAVDKGTVDHFLLAQALKKAGMKMADIQLVPLETSKATDAFAAGQVDAVAAFEPFTAKALKRPGSRELFSSKNFPGSISDHLVFNRKFVNEHPEQVQAVVNSWFATLHHINSTEHQDDSIGIMAKRAGSSTSEYKKYLEGTKIFNVDDNIEAFKPGSDNTYLSITADDINQFLFENKIIKSKVDTSKLFDDRFVKAFAAKGKV